MVYCVVPESIHTNHKEGLWIPVMCCGYERCCALSKTFFCPLFLNCLDPPLLFEIVSSLLQCLSPRLPPYLPRLSLCGKASLQNIRARNKTPRKTKELGMLKCNHPLPKCVPKTTSPPPPLNSMFPCSLKYQQFLCSLLKVI